MPTQLRIPEFLALDKQGYLLLDVRSPAEYAQGHIPGARSFPLFTDTERAVVGTIYSHSGQRMALEEGLKFVGPRMAAMSAQAADLAGDMPVVVHCWRGGKRSESVGWLLEFSGLKVNILTGGYKAYRAHLRQWAQSQRFRFIILGGKTGSGKTHLLHALRSSGEQVLDLEDFANHKGSAFGWIGEDMQPSNEHFENLVVSHLMTLDPAKRIWVENESRSIGRVFVPEQIWEQMQSAPLIHIEVSDSERIACLVDLYATGTNLSELKTSFEKIGKRLGGQHLRDALAALQAGDLAVAAEIALVYYDKTYLYDLEQRKPDLVRSIDLCGLPIAHKINKILTVADEMADLET